jgi:hypothetical protein
VFASRSNDGSIARAFPKTSKRILEDSQAILRGKVFGIVDDELQSHEFSALQDSNLSKKLVESYHEIIVADPDGWKQIAAERMDIVRRYDAEYRRLRNEYERNMAEVFEHTSSYFSDASKNLERLNQVAARVKLCLSRRKMLYCSVVRAFRARSSASPVSGSSSKSPSSRSPFSTFEAWMSTSCSFF